MISAIVVALMDGIVLHHPLNNGFRNICCEEIYSQCARAVMRARLWAGEDAPSDLPTVGEILAEMTDGAEGGKSYEDAWGPRAAKTMW